MKAEIEEGDMDGIMPCTRRSSSSSAASSNPAAAAPPLSPAVEIIILAAATSDGRHLLLPLLPPRHMPGAQNPAHSRPRIAAGACVAAMRRSVVASMLLPLPCWSAAARCNLLLLLEPPSKRESSPTPFAEQELGVLPPQRQGSIVCFSNGIACCSVLHSIVMLSPTLNTPQPAECLRRTRFPYKRRSFCRGQRVEISKEPRDSS